MYKDLIESINNNNFSNAFDKDSFVYPISEFNFEAVKILIHNCFQQGQSNSSNVEWVSVNPSIWLPELLENNLNHIKMVSTGPNFHILKKEQDDLVYQNYTCDSIRLENDEELNEFFSKNRWKSLVIFTITKIADLRTMSYWYNIRFADITEKFEQRDNKIKEILE
jgi:hypothetical protein